MGARLTLDGATGFRATQYPLFSPIKIGHFCRSYATAFEALRQGQVLKGEAIIDPKG